MLAAHVNEILILCKACSACERYSGMFAESWKTLHVVGWYWWYLKVCIGPVLSVIGDYNRHLW